MKTGKRVNNKTQIRRSGRRKKSSGGGPHAPSSPVSSFDLDCPKNFRLTDNFGAVVGAISKLRQLLGKQGARRPPRIRFSKIAAIDVTAALMLGAEVQMLGAEVPAPPGMESVPPHFYNGSWNPEVQALLTRMGLFALLDSSRQGVRKRPRVADLAPIPVISSSNVDMAKFTAMREQIEAEIKGPMSTSQFLFIGLSEAVTNAVQHAYKNHEHKQWWASASYGKSKQELTILCYDRGLTIPKTLPSSSLWETTRNMMSLFNLHEGVDCDMIEGALRTRRTKTKQQHRGRGLPQLMNLIDQVERGALRIYSRKGMVEYTKSESKEGGNYERTQLGKPIMGTLIEWKIFLSPEKMAKNSPYSHNSKSRQAPLLFRGRRKI